MGLSFKIAGGNAGKKPTTEKEFKLAELKAQAGPAKQSPTKLIREFLDNNFPVVVGQQCDCGKHKAKYPRFHEYANAFFGKHGYALSLDLEQATGLNCCMVHRISDETLYTGRVLDPKKAARECRKILERCLFRYGSFIVPKAALEKARIKDGEFILRAKKEEEKPEVTVRFSERGLPIFNLSSIRKPGNGQGRQIRFGR